MFVCVWGGIEDRLMHITCYKLMLSYALQTCEQTNIFFAGGIFSLSAELASFVQDANRGTMFEA